MCRARGGGERRLTGTCWAMPQHKNSLKGSEMTQRQFTTISTLQLISVLVAESYLMQFISEAFQSVSISPLR